MKDADADGAGGGGRFVELEDEDFSFTVGIPPSLSPSSSSLRPVPVLREDVEGTLPSVLPAADLKLSSRLPFLLMTPRVDPVPTLLESS